MSLSPGTRLGPYEVLSAIGAGGMGEVTGTVLTLVRVHENADIWMATSP